MKSIPLSQGKFALVDDEDFDYQNQWKWSAQKHQNTFYAVRHPAGKKNETIYMHREIMKTPAGMLTDHIDHNGLNNQRYNLRICNNAKNQFNGQKRPNNTSGYKGVIKVRGGWEARLVKDDKRVFRKVFRSLEEAALAYDEAAREHYGEFASLNFPNRAPTDV